MKNLEEILNFLSERGFSLTTSNRRRVCGPNVWDLPEPKYGSQVFVGKIPHYLFENDLIPLFEEIGPIYKFCLMTTRNGLNRGYAFVTFANPEDADRAVECLHLHHIRSNRYIGVHKSIDNCRLYLGKIPVQKTMEEVRAELDEHLDGVVKVVMYPGYLSKDVNRGYAFVEFSSHAMAAKARKKLNNRVVLWETALNVDWAEPIPYVAQNVMDKVTALYVRNLPVDITKKAFAKEIDDVTGNASAILSVCKKKDFAFLSFDSRVNAKKALDRLTNLNFCGNVVEVAWSRPFEYRKFMYSKAHALNFCRSVPSYMRKLVYYFKAVQRSNDLYVLSKIKSSRSHGGSPRCLWYMNILKW